MAYIKQIKAGSTTYDIRGAIVHYGTCSTGATTAAKTVSCTGFQLVTGAVVYVKFTAGIEAISTLNVNSTGAKNIEINFSVPTTEKDNTVYLRGTLLGEVLCFIYDGSKYILVNDVKNKMTWCHAGSNSTTDLTLTSGTITKVPLNQVLKEWDAMAASCPYELSNDGGIFIETPGFYRISGGAYIKCAVHDSTSTGKRHDVFIYKTTNSKEWDAYNSTKVELMAGSLFINIGYTAQSAIFTGSKIVYLDTGDILYLAARITNTTSGDRYVDLNHRDTYLDVDYLGMGGSWNA